MKQKILDQFRESIVDHRNTLMKWMNDQSADKAINLGTASIAEVLSELEEFKEVLGKLEDRSFGKCICCDGEVETDRLEQDYTTVVCLDCYSEEQLRELERDLELAAKVQKQLLPGYVPEIAGVEFAMKYAAAHAVGGDYYDFFTLKNGYQGFAIGDVMGKGLAASMLMSNLQASLRILGPDYLHLGQLTGHLNRLFQHNLKLIRFISLFIGAIDISENRLYYCNAGHHAPLHWEAGQGKIHRLNPTAPAIGLVSKPKISSESLPVGSGDLIVLYTDGVIEARDHRNEEYGEQRLIEYIEKNYQLSAADLTNGIWNDVKKRSERNVDDMTIMTIRID